MSYSRRSAFGLGDALPRPASAAYGSLPAFEQGAYMRQYEHEVQWGRIGDDALLDQILAVLISMKAALPGATKARVGGRLPEEGHFIQGLKNLWIRMGRHAPMWPGARGEFNFGPNTNNAKDLRISEALYNLLKAPPGLWRKQADGFVRLHVTDPLYARDVRDKLVGYGYMDRGMPASTKDDSSMVKALRRWWDEAREQGINVGRWPDGINFGPNTNGDEIRISEELLTNLLTGVGPRAAAAGKQAAAGFRAGALRPPVYGTLASSSPQRLSLSPDVLREILSKSLITHAAAIPLPQSTPQQAPAAQVPLQLPASSLLLMSPKK